jgi:opacity protein-like surface antigen
VTRLGWWPRWLVAAVALSCAAGAPAQEPVADPGAGPDAPARPPGPPPLARGWFGAALGGVADANGAGFMLRVSAGRPVSERLRLDLAFTVVGKSEDFPVQGLAIADVPDPRAGLLHRSLGWLQLVAGWEAGRFEPWLGLGAGFTDVQAEVRGPTTVECVPFLGCFESTPQADDAATRFGPVVSLGTNFVISSSFLTGLELHLPLIQAARLDAIPMRFTTARPIFMVTATWRGGRPPAGEAR